MIRRELAKAGIAVLDPKRAPETEALFNSLDPASKRDLMEKVDEQFFARTDFPKGKKIPSKDHPMAAKWSAIRDEVIAGMVIPQGSDRAKPKTTTDLPLPIGYVPQHEREIDELNQELQKYLHISDERMATLSSWSDANYMAESGDGEVGGQRLAAAVLGKSELGALSAAEKSALVRQCAVKWMYSPSTGEEGALKNIKNFTEIMKAQKDPKIDRAIAIMYLQSTKQVRGQSFEGGDLRITAIPVSHMNREYGPALYKVLRVEKPGERPYFVDHEGGSYKSVGDWLADNDLPPGMVTFPGDLDLKNGPVTKRTKNSGKVERGKVLLQSAAHKAAMVAGVLVVVGTGGAAAPLVGTVSGIIAVEGTIETLINKHDRGFDVTDLGNAQIRGLYLDIAANAFSLGAVGSTKLIKGLSKQGAQVSRAGANVIAGLTWAGNVTDAVQIMDQINNLANKWESLTPEQQGQELKSLGITLAMKTASVKKGGGKFRDEIDFTRLRSMIEHRCPYPVNNVDPDPNNPGRTIWVKNDGGKMTIEFVGKSEVVLLFRTGSRLG